MTEVYEELREKGFNFAEMAEGNWKKNLAGTAACENSIAGNADGLVVPRNVPSVPASQPAPPNAIAKPTAQYLSEMIRWTLGHSSIRSVSDSTLQSEWRSGRRRRTQSIPTSSQGRRGARCSPSATASLGPST
jgi:hypothetical protein